VSRGFGQDCNIKTASPGIEYSVTQTLTNTLGYGATALLLWWIVFFSSGHSHSKLKTGYQEFR